MTLISAVRSATSSSIATSNRTRLSPTRPTSNWPARAVMPVESRLSLTTNRFGDYWKLGLPLLVLYGVVAVLLVPVFWQF